VLALAVAAQAQPSPATRALRLAPGARSSSPRAHGARCDDAAVVTRRPPPFPGLRVEYLATPLTIDVATPRFSYALVHSARAQAQTAYRLVVTTAAGAPVWNSGVVASNNTLNIAYGGPALASDADYVWSVIWTDASGATAPAATSTFSTALYDAAAWRGATWVSSAPNGSLNTYRAEFSLPAAPARARLYMHGLGYAKTWLNDASTDDHELGTFTTFQQRTLYDVIDVTGLLKPGCNAIGVMLGHGWFAQPRVHAGDRQFRLLLSVTDAGGATTYFASSNAPGAPGALVFAAAAGPVTADDIYEGESYDGRVAAALAGWAACGFKPAAPWAALRQLTLRRCCGSAAQPAGLALGRSSRAAPKHRSRLAEHCLARW
jgi:alpha-L-rhamnosidase